MCIKTRHVYIARLDNGRPKGNVSRVASGDSLAAQGKHIVPLFFSLDRQRTKRYHGESVSERKCTRIKAPALPLYNSTRIYGPLPGVVYTILHNISVGKARKPSSLAIRSVETRPTDAVRFIANVNTAKKIRVGAKYLAAFPATDRIETHPH